MTLFFSILILHFIQVERLVPVLVLSKMDVADDLANFDLIPYDETNWHLEDTTILFSGKSSGS